MIENKQKYLEILDKIIDEMDMETIVRLITAGQTEIAAKLLKILSVNANEEYALEASAAKLDFITFALRTRRKNINGAEAAARELLDFKDSFKI